MADCAEHTYPPEPSAGSSAPESLGAAARPGSVWSLGLPSLPSLPGRQSWRRAPASTASTTTLTEGATAAKTAKEPARTRPDAEKDAGKGAGISSGSECGSSSDSDDDDESLNERFRNMSVFVDMNSADRRQETLRLFSQRMSSDYSSAEEDSCEQPPIMFSSTSSDFVTFQPDKPLRFTCLTIGSRGDVQPYIALCKGLIAQGHSCKIASHGEYREWVESHGIAFEAVGGDPAALMQLMIAHNFFTISFMKEAVGRFRGWLDDLLETSWRACQGCDVLIESPSAIAGLHIAEALEVPYYRAFTMPWSRTRAYPHAFAVPEHKMGGRYNYMTYVMFDQIFWRATKSQVNRWRRKVLGLHSTSLEQMNQQAVPFLYNFSPVVVPPARDWRENIHVTGYWWLDNAHADDSHADEGGWQAPQDVLDFLDKARVNGKKVIFIGFGSIIIPDPDEMTRIVTESVGRAEVYAIIAKGWSDRAASKEDSAEEKRELEAQEEKHAQILDKDYILNIKSIPHDWLFPRIDAAVHHGGAGTTGASLRAGLPTIIKPFFGDQHFYADRVAALGIGAHIKAMTVEHLTNAIAAAVGDEEQIARAREVGRKIREENGVETAIECIYRDFEYAKSLIRKRQTADKPLAEELKHVDSTLANAGKKIGAPIKSLLASKKDGEHKDDRSPPTSPPNGSSDEGWDVLSNRSSTRNPDSDEENAHAHAHEHERVGGDDDDSDIEEGDPPGQKHSRLAKLRALPHAVRQEVEGVLSLPGKHADPIQHGVHSDLSEKV